MGLPRSRLPGAIHLPVNSQGDLQEPHSFAQSDSFVRHSSTTAVPIFHPLASKDCSSYSPSGIKPPSAVTGIQLKMPRSTDAACTSSTAPL